MTFKSPENIPDLPFTFPSYGNWEQVARQELGGPDPTKKLSIKKGDLEILPFYTASHAEKKQSPRLKPSLQQFNGARNWINTPKILVSDENIANKEALSYLNSGAEGVLFDCPSDELNLKVLLNNISLPDCSVSFLLNQNEVDWLDEFRLYVEKNFDKQEIKGSLFWSSKGYDTKFVNSFSDWPQFHSLGIIVGSLQNASDEIAQALTKMVELIEAVAEKNNSNQAIFDQISFSLSITNDFFLELAKLKSLRNLWHQIKSAYGVSGSKPLHLHVGLAGYTNANFQPHANMIHATTSAMAAIIGGCDSLTIEPEIEDNETMRRIAINVSSILREESHFAKVADPTAGSYYIDALTNQLSEKAWKKFQSLVK